VKLLEHTAAFGTLSNQGVYHQPVAILKVEDSKGNVLIEYKEKKRKVMNKDNINILTNMLSDDAARAYVFGAGSYLTLPGRPAAAKTGTTNDYRDAWTVGYTPSLVAGVWVGNNDNSEMKKGAAGGVVAAPIWHNFMAKALEGSPVDSFPEVEIEKTGKPILDGEVSPEIVVKIDKHSGKLANEFTPESSIEEKKFRDAHSILHYVYKDDPQGGAPENPASTDSAYEQWEAGVQDWIKRTDEEGGEDSEFIFETPPTEYDNVHTEENKPTIFIVNPKNNQTISDTTLSASINASAPRGVHRVEYYIDNILIATKTNAPFNLHYLLSSYFSKGYHKLRVIAYDDVDNSNETQIDLNITVELPEPSVIWTSISSGEIIKQSQFPVQVNMKLTDLVSSKKVDFYQRKMDTGQINLLSTVILPKQSNIVFEWPAVFEQGEYQLYVDIVDPGGKHFKSSSVGVTVE